MNENMQKNSPQSFTRRDLIRLGTAAAALPMLGDIAALCRVPASSRASVEWRQCSGDKASTKYSTLDQINRDNFSNLKVAWTWQSAEQDILKEHNVQT